MRGLKLAFIPGMLFFCMSHLLQMRGLKLSEPVDAKSAPVASFTDAWIETKIANDFDYFIASHLLQMRGLKPGSVIADITVAIVASFTDAWIETGINWKSVQGYIVASFTDAWIETAIKGMSIPGNTVASFTDAWIETGGGGGGSVAWKSHLLQMRGLKPFTAT